jgi:hypothetical protein
MVSRRELMYGKIALLERVVKDILISGFLTSPNPTAAAKEYASSRRALPPDFDADPHFELARQEVWNVFLDDVVGGVRKLSEDKEPS